MNDNKLLKLQSVVLFLGTIFAFYTVYTDFARFYGLEGTLFKVKNCVIPNPVVTPCFYGAFGFLIAFVLSVKILKTIDLDKIKKKQRTLLFVLIGCTVFAWGNFFFTLYKYFRALSLNEAFTGCSGVTASHPFVTPCFIGSAIFLIALLVGISLDKRFHK